MLAMSRWSAALLSAVVAGSVIVVPAQANQADQADPPARVGRISYVSGTTSFRPGDADDWSPATLNYPLTSGDHLWTDVGGRSEIQMGATAFRLGDATSFSFLTLDDRTAQVRLAQGEVEVTVRELGSDETLEIDTPSGAVTLQHPGLYRFSVDSTGDTTVVLVRQGAADMTAGGRSFSVPAGQTAVVTGGDAPTYALDPAIAPDALERWGADRDRRDAASQSAQYVSRDMVGYEELDDYGAWQTAPEYGAVWVPRVAAGWAPYRDGRWVWRDPWGWTWIDAAPWGFAPFHYGRWAYWGNRWVWAPGRIVARPVYAPALVAFVGGAHWGVSVGFGGGGGGVGWFPLAPNEPWVPGYRVSRTYVRNVNVTNVTNVTNITNVNVTNIHYVNRGVAGATTVVSQTTFAGARPVRGGQVRLSERELAAAPIAGTTAPFAPNRESMTGVVSGPVVRPPTRVTQRAVVTRVTPAPRPVPFEVQQQQLAAAGGRPLDAEQQAALRANVRNQPNAPAPRTIPAAEARAPIMRPMRGGDRAAPLRPNGAPAAQPVAPTARPAAPAAQPAAPAPRPAAPDGQAVRPEAPSRSDTRPNAARPGVDRPGRPQSNGDDRAVPVERAQPAAPPANQARPAPSDTRDARPARRVERPQPSQPQPSQPAPQRDTPSRPEPAEKPDHPDTQPPPEARAPAQRPTRDHGGTRHPRPPKEPKERPHEERPER